MCGSRKIRTYTGKWGQDNLEELSSNYNEYKDGDDKTYLEWNHAYNLLTKENAVYCLKHNKKIKNFDNGDDVKSHYHWIINSSSEYIKMKGLKDLSSINLGNISTIYEKNNFVTNLFSYVTTFNNESKINEHDYEKNAAQQAIWLETGYIDDKFELSEQAEQLWKASKAIDMYEAEVKIHGSTPKVSSENANVELLGDNESNYEYKIGPFKMSDYAYLYSEAVKDYSGKDNTTGAKDGLVGGISGAKIILDNDIEFEIGSSNCRIEYKKIQDGSNDRMGSKGLSDGIKGSYKKNVISEWSAPENYNYPWPNSEFYLIINKSSCLDATMLKEIKITYQSTRTDAKGWVAQPYRYSKLYHSDKNNETYLGEEHQPLLIVQKAAVYVEETDYANVFDIIFLPPKVSIDKYITKVEHVAENGVLYDNSNGRKEKNIDWKEKFSIKVENGDKVTFKIVLKNDSVQDVEVKIQDILPKNKYNYSFDTDVNGWIEVPASGKREIVATVDIAGAEGTYCNTAKIKALRLKGSKTEYDIKNLTDSKLEDSDYYTIKEYNVNIDKSIVKVEHAVNGNETYNGTGRKNIDDNSKLSNPVYAEYGDKVTYEIDIFNTTTPYINDRGASPYWTPGKVFVNVEDTLPNKYSNLSISVKVGNKEPSTISNVKVENGKFKLTNIEVPSDRKTTITVSLVVEEHDKSIQEKNTARIIGKTLNINKREIKNNSDKIESADYYHINDYNVSINKYINAYNHEMTDINNSNGFTNEKIKITDRYSMSEEDKENKPLAVEKTETLVYSIRLNNESITEQKGLESGTKSATSVRIADVTDTLDYGLSYKSVSAKAYKADGSEKYGDLPVTAKNIGNNTYKFTVANKTSDGKEIVLNPSEYMIYYVTVEVTQTNMYLYKLSNMAIITTLTNINHTDKVSRVVKNDEYDENISKIQTSRDFVKLKDLVISGKVWLDSDKDGYMGKNASGILNSYIDYETNPSTNIAKPAEDSEYAMKGIVVKLYSINGDTSKLVRTTKTDENGLFTFGRDEIGSWYAGTYSYDGNPTESDQRIPKATNKDQNLNYSTNSEYISYYIEYEYDGLVYKSTEIYSGTDNLESDGSLSSGDKYKIDSNAKELSNARNEFNLNHEIVSYNKTENGTLTNPVKVEYEKDGHNSYLKINKDRIMTARSFVVDSEESDVPVTKYLWLFKQSKDFDKPETEYLKYINLGLEERSDIDISVVQDVYEIKNTINGEEATYFYNQNKYAKDGSSVDHDETTSDDYTAEFYMTRKKEDSSNDTAPLNPYTFKYYLADYNYKYDDYNIDTVKEYKGIQSELNSEISFRIKVTNNQSGSKGAEVYAGINEVIEYFDSDFVNVTYKADGTIDTITVKTKDENGYLVNTDLKIAEAYFALPDGSSVPAVVSNKSLYNTDQASLQNKANVEKNGYHTVYIRPSENDVSKIILANGENVDIIVKFTLDKDADRNIKLGLKTAIAEIGAYSTYYNAEGTIPAGFIDKDSNPGNFGETYDGISFDSSKNNKENDPYLALYEDDTYKTGIELKKQNDVDNERSIKGQVWDDARSETLADENGIEYIGDGIYDRGTKDKNAKLNTVLKNINGTYKEVNDFLVNDVRVKLVEIIKIPVDSSGKVITDSSITPAEERIYEQTIVANSDSIMDTRTAKNSSGKDGQYILKGYIPGEYIVRFFYGDDASLEQMTIFNGQDYKSTTYQNGIETYADEITDEDTVLEILENKDASGKFSGTRLSDAKDNEIRRLETISYSETINNNKTLILRGKNSNNKDIQAEKTSMDAETVDFLVRAEKVKKSQKALTYAETMDKINNPERHPIENIDFGLQYRPEQQVALNKFVKNLTITTSDANSGTKQALVDARFNEYYGVVADTNTETGITKFLSYTDSETGEDIVLKVDKDATTAQITSAIESIGANASSLPKNQDGSYQVVIAGTELDTENSIGLSNLQYVPNEGDAHDEDSIQGFLYLNIDDEIMQGAEVKIQYLFTGHNLSEIDRINENLSALRFKDNVSSTGEYTYYETIDSGLYSGALTARKSLYDNYYAKENSTDVVYRKKEFSIGEDKDSNYYGAYLGLAYYTGKIGSKDIVAELKLNKILDYVDNNLVFKQEDNTANSSGNLWTSTTASELVLGGYVQPKLIKIEDKATNKVENYNDLIKDVAKNADISKESLEAEVSKAIQLYSNKTRLQDALNSGISIVTPQSREVLGKLNESFLEDTDNIRFNTDERSNLAVLQDIRTSDSQTENDIANADITKYLSPRSSEAGNSFGLTSIITSKVIAAGEDTENISYENIGEIIEYSSVTGRVTNLNTTLGNVDFTEPSRNSNSPEYEQSRKKESDTSSVEKVTLTPPTGLNRANRIIRTAVKGASYVGLISISVAIIAIITIGGIKLYRKRSIK